MRADTLRITSIQAPPHNCDAEQAVLGGLFLAAQGGDTESLGHLEALGEDHFYLKPHRTIFATIRKIHQAGQLPDLLTVTDALRQENKLDAVGGASFVTGLLSATFSPTTLTQHVSILRRDAGKRTLADLGMELTHAAGNGKNLEALVAFTERVLNNVRETGFDSPTNKESSWEKRIVTASELVAGPQREQAWHRLWGQPGLIGPGLVTLLSGHSKQAGKSTSLAAGLHGLYRERPDLNVLVLSEEPRPIWAHRLQTWEFQPAQLQFRFADGTSWGTHLREIETVGPQILLVDTLRSFVGCEDESDAAKVVEVLQPLVILTRRKSIATVVTHHLRKSEGEGGLSHSGSTALVALSDIGLEMRQDKAHAPNRRVLRSVSRFDVTPREFVLELQANEIVYLGAPDALTIAEVTERVFAVLQGMGRRVSRDEILEALEDPRPSSEQVARALKTLHGRDRVERSGRGVRGNPHLWEIKSTTKQPLSRGNESDETIQRNAPSGRLGAVAQNTGGRPTVPLERG